MNSYLVTFDLEFSGPNMLIHGIVSIGAALSWYDNNNFRFVKEFYRECNILPCQIDPETADTFFSRSDDLKSLLQRALNGECMEVEKAIHDLVKFFKECHEQTNKNMIICSNRTDIDCSWLNLYLCRYGHPPLHMLFRDEKSLDNKIIKIVDTNSFHQAAAKDMHSDVINFDGRMYSPNESAFRKLDIQQRPKTIYDHCALNDAKWLAEAHVLILQQLFREKSTPVQQPTFINNNNNNNNNFGSVTPRRKPPSGVSIFSGPVFGDNHSPTFYASSMGSNNVSFLMPYQIPPQRQPQLRSYISSRPKLKSDDFRVDDVNFPRLNKNN